MSWDEIRLKKFETHAYVLDYLPHGKIGTHRERFRAEPLIQLLGVSYFTLLEATPRIGFTLSPNERVYVGKERFRNKISHIIGRIEYDKLTSAARSELPIVVEEIVMKDEKRFLNFFNTAQAVTPRMHSLELIPGIGKKYTWTILDTREKRLFSSFQDVRERTEIPDPAKLIVKRILEELSQSSKYRLFVRLP
jgi:putative nucleotide binding protein